MPLFWDLQQGGKLGMGYLYWPGGCIEFFFLLPPGKPLLLQTMNSATPFVVVVYFLFLSSLHWLGWPPFFVGGWGASDQHPDPASIFPATMLTQRYGSCWLWRSSRILWVWNYYCYDCYFVWYIIFIDDLYGWMKLQWAYMYFLKFIQ